MALATFLAMASRMASGVLRLFAMYRSLKNETTEPSEARSTRTETPARSVRTGATAPDRDGIGRDARIIKVFADKLSALRATAHGRQNSC